MKKCALNVLRMKYKAYYVIVDAFCSGKTKPPTKLFGSLRTYNIIYIIQLHVVLIRLTAL